MPEENIKDFLTTYLNHANHPSLSIEQLTLEFNLFTAYINLSKYHFNLTYRQSTEWK